MYACSSHTLTHALTHTRARHDTHAMWLSPLLHQPTQGPSKCCTATLFLGIIVACSRVYNPKLITSPLPPDTMTDSCSSRLPCFFIRQQSALVSPPQLHQWAQIAQHRTLPFPASILHLHLTKGSGQWPWSQLVKGHMATWRQHSPFITLSHPITSLIADESNMIYTYVLWVLNYVLCVKE